MLREYSDSMSHPRCQTWPRHWDQWGTWASWKQVWPLRADKDCKKSQRRLGRVGQRSWERKDEREGFEEKEKN